ncbi:nucleotide exchange factor GrpE [Sinomonas sp. ASV322]|uniref:nucleotide exchange factor GrpE n=1 Tax=Sinomonas sp. ASV322 TaxID=3041920 RepID=UPI0027DC30EE|nr:nucleotide exchange factor GrpE [Sinomonas sp. ASV322]MDQ4502486.1 nucleotide exchange factor GrpE [Sinomonas sp. ASV322]
MAPHHGNDDEHEVRGEPQKPVIRDNRKVDPVTGGVRQPDQGASEKANDGGRAASADAGGPQRGGSEHEDLRPVDEAHDAEDVLAQAERILSEAAGIQDEAAELREDLQRLQAEYINYRKRVDRDRAVAGEVAVMGVLTSLLPVLDDIDAARAHGDLSDGPFASIAAKLEQILTSHGLERIDATGVEFDPNIHEALIQQPGEGITVDTVQQVLRSGYRTQARVLRAAQVIVAVP